MKLAPVDLKKLRDKVEKGIIKREMYDELVNKVNAIHTTDIGSLLKNWL